MEVLGNDLILTDHRADVDYQLAAQQLCCRRRGIGSDGLLTIEDDLEAPLIRMWNPDGTEDFCGNGLCCAALLLSFRLQRETFCLITPSRKITALVERAGLSRQRVTVDLGSPLFSPNRVPTTLPQDAHAIAALPIEVLGKTLEVVPVSTGSTHCVVLVDKLPPDPEFLSYSPAIERHDVFPTRTSVIWVRVVDGELEMRIWERGVGETPGCGTGAAAAAAVCLALQLIRSPTVVKSPGGNASVAQGAEGQMRLTTMPRLVFEGHANVPS